MIYNSQHDNRLVSYKIIILWNSLLSNLSLSNCLFQHCYLGAIGFSFLLVDVVANPEIMKTLSTYYLPFNANPGGRFRNSKIYHLVPRPSSFCRCQHFFPKKSVFFAKNSTLIKTDYASGIWLPDCSKLAVNWKNDNDVTFFKHDVIVNFFWRCFVFLVKLVTGPCFMSMSSLVLELRHIPFIKDWPEIRKSEIPPSEFCPIPGHWGE